MDRNIIIIVLFIIAFIYCIFSWNNTSSMGITDSIGIMDASTLENLNSIVETTIDGP